MTRSVICVWHSQQEQDNCNDRFRSTLRAASERYKRARKMREVWSNHAPRQRNVRELPPEQWIGKRWRGISGLVSKCSRRNRRLTQAVVPGKLRNSRADRLRRYGRDLSRKATTFPARRRSKTRS